MMIKIRSTLLAALLTSVASAAGEHTHTTVTSLEEGLHGLELMAKFSAWINEFEKSYETHEDFNQRLHNWLSNDGESIRKRYSCCFGSLD